jgi:hypothetical protein
MVAPAEFIAEGAHPIASTRVIERAGRVRLGLPANAFLY